MLLDNAQKGCNSATKNGRFESIGSQVMARNFLQKVSVFWWNKMQSSERVTPPDLKVDMSNILGPVSCKGQAPDELQFWASTCNSTASELVSSPFIP
uniref:Uncharacterized protein n=1 Tax=Romanomermis culicivorax TaxID=13658 RepID=A0A915HLE5_ROMCU